jgi:hypothetical protein
MGYDPERNCGCIVGALATTPFALLWLIVNALGGFGCEGADQPCTPHNGRFWLGVFVIGAAGSAIAWLVNALRRWLRRKHD